MNLHYETVSPLLKETLQKLVNSPIFKDFTLIGGTCLSLQLGHRRSIDIDLFTDIDYGTMNTKEMKEFIQRSFPYSENTDSLDTSALGYTLYMGDSPIDKIKVFTCKKLLMTKKKLPVRFTGQHFTIDKVLIKDAIRQANIT